MKTLRPKKIILIGASTGGPGQIQKIINSLPKLHDVTLIIAQHMVQGFMDSFAKRLQDNSINNIEVIKNNQVLESAHIYLCEGNTYLKTSGSNLIFNQSECSPNSFNPDINVLFNSFIPLCNSVDIMSVILTGIGDDGIDACKTLSISGAKCITETGESAIVDGMPQRARALVPDIEAEDIKTIIKMISEFCDV